MADYEAWTDEDWCLSMEVQDAAVNDAESKRPPYGLCFKMMQCFYTLRECCAPRTVEGDGPYERMRRFAGFERRTL